MRDIGLGVIVVTFNSGGEAVDCVESLAAAGAAVGVTLRIVVVDNASTDDTVARLRDWGDGSAPYGPPNDAPFDIEPVPKPLSIVEAPAGTAADPASRLVLLRNPVNAGFAGGVNVGLAYLAALPDIDHYWVLNPDSLVPPETLDALANALPQAGRYALMGGRMTYVDPPDKIQIDGGVVNRRTGVVSGINLGKRHADTPMPSPDDLDFVMGGSMIASRAFVEAVGPMREAYFLYYEEVDWAMRRGDLPLRCCVGLRVYHRAGSSIGSPNPTRRASPFSLYFKHRGRIMFTRRFFPRSLPIAWAYSMAYAARLLRHGAVAETQAVLAGTFNRPPPAAIRARLDPGAARSSQGAGV